MRRRSPSIMLETCSSGRGSSLIKKSMRSERFRHHRRSTAPAADASLLEKARIHGLHIGKADTEGDGDFLMDGLHGYAGVLPLRVWRAGGGD